MVNAGKHHILDVVEIPSESRKGIVYDVRAYSDGRFRYTVGYLDDDDGALFSEDQLESTGKRVSPEIVLVSPIPIRTVVRISEQCEFPEVRNMTGVVTGSNPKSELFVWFEELKRVFILEIGDLSPTGERLPPEGPRKYTSTQVSTSGEVLGEESYVVIEDVCDL